MKETSGVKKKEVISYEDQRCLLCRDVHATSLLISIPQKVFVLCRNCAKELKERLP